jgi:molybdopterin synthase catalytic subunit
MDLRERPSPRRLCTDRIDLAALVAEIATLEDGAICTFAGVVRRISDGREVAALRYDAYPEMAEKVLARIVEDAALRHPDARIAVRHRVGPCPLGEASVAIAAAAPHRDSAFAACRFAIDSIKREAPIWKHETYTDGTAWIGDPGSFQPARERPVP